MFLIRLGVVALVILLFLPGPPAAPVSAGGGDGFCDRYPKTCDASVEIGEALKYKAMFAIVWLSTKAGVHVPGLPAAADGPAQRRGDATPYSDTPRHVPSQRFDERYDRGTLSDADRRPYWPETSARRDVYPGR